LPQIEEIYVRIRKSARAIRSYEPQLDMQIELLIATASGKILEKKALSGMKLARRWS
jgi:hypothetical protein